MLQKVEKQNVELQNVESYKRLNNKTSKITKRRKRSKITKSRKRWKIRKSTKRKKNTVQYGKNPRVATPTGEEERRKSATESG
jgi:hypothetical protein